MPSGHPITVDLDPPAVEGSTVTYSWSQEGDDPLQLRNRWSLTYDGVPLERMNRRLLYDVFFSLQLPVWQLLGVSVTVRLPEPVGRVTTEFWTAYHAADRVSLTGPVDETRSYDPRPPLVERLRARRAGVPERHDAAVTFGGGKDSTLAHEVLVERRAARNVLLIHIVQHFSTRAAAMRETAERSLSTILAPNEQRHGSPVQLVSTDFLAVLRPRASAARPHVTIYNAALLPALVHRGVHQVVFSRTAMGYRVRRMDSGELFFSHPTGRAEKLAHLRDYCADVLGWPLHSESTHRAVGEFVSFSTLLRRYPDAFARMVMCTRTRSAQRFCQDCTKCLEFAVMGLAHGHVAPDLDYDALLTSPTVRGLAQRATALGGERAWHGAGPYHRAIGTRPTSRPSAMPCTSWTPRTPACPSAPPPGSTCACCARPGDRSRSRPWSTSTTGPWPPPVRWDGRWRR